MKTSRLARERPATSNNKLVKFEFIFDWVYQTPNELFVKYNCQLEREVSVVWIQKLREHLVPCQLTLSSTNLLHIEKSERQTNLLISRISIQKSSLEQCRCALYSSGKSLQRIRCSVIIFMPKPYISCIKRMLELTICYWNLQPTLSPFFLLNLGANIIEQLKRKGWTSLHADQMSCDCSIVSLPLCIFITNGSA